MGARVERQDTTLPYWTIDQAAMHFGLTRAAIRGYVRAGLPTYLGGVAVKPGEVIAERLRRLENLRNTQARK